jgi:hypothetical protein
MASMAAATVDPQIEAHLFQTDHAAGRQVRHVIELGLTRGRALLCTRRP